MRLFCATNLCNQQALALQRAAQTAATLRAQLAQAEAERDALALQLAQAEAERDALALQLAQARRERDAAKESAEFYLDLFCMTKETQHGG